MRSRSLARVVIASLGVSVVITLGCGKSSPAPSPSPTRFSVGWISPTEGATFGTDAATIGGTGFQSGDTVTVDGSRVDATVLSADAISLAMPAHAAGKVDVTVSRIGAQSLSVPGGYTYVVIPPPVISELVPNTGSTAGSPPIIIKGTGTLAMWRVVTVTVDGIVSPFDIGWPYDGSIYLLEPMPAHAAGTVEVIVTDRYGQTGSSEFTYASPATFDFNGDWEGTAVTSPYTGRIQELARLVLTIRDNIVGSVLCSVCQDAICAIGSAPSLTLDPPPVVANGEFSFAGSGGTITGHILTSNYASGSINMAPCGSRQWSARKRR